MTKIVVVIVDGLPVSLAEQLLPQLPLLSSRLPHRGTAVSCFPSTTGPAYFPFLSGCTPGRADVPGIRWFDRTALTRSRFPHRGLRSYVGPDAKRLATDTRARTIFARHAWPASSPVQKDLPKRGEAGRDAIWTLAHFTHGWHHADARTARKLARGLRKGREIVFAVFPSVDELGHVHGIASGRPGESLVAIDRLLEERLDGFDGHLLLSADHGLTDTHTHLDLRALVEGLAGPTLAFPLVVKPNPAAVVCESGNAMANVYLRGERGWSERPPLERCRELAGALVLLEGIGSVAIRGVAAGTAELWTKHGVGEVGIDPGGLFQRGEAFRTTFEGASKKRTVVFGAVERGGRVRATIIGKNRNAEAVSRALCEFVLPAAMIYTDDWGGYDPLNRMGYTRHRRINHSAKIYVQGPVHTQTIEGFFGLFKTGLVGAHHSVSYKWLQGYLNEWTWRYNRRGDDNTMFRDLLKESVK